MKVVFLDVDGVLCHSGTIERGKQSGEVRDTSFYQAALVDPACVKRVLQICTATGAVLVLSSAWRKFDHQRTGLKRAFLQAGLPREEHRRIFFGSTPVLDDDRSKEISSWLAAHPTVERYLVLDDSFVGGHPMASPLPSYHDGGLQDETVAMAIAYLNAP